MHYFITGTDTDCGKTYVTSLLLAHFQQQGHTAVGYKPVCSGGRSDAEILLKASSPGLDLDTLNPCWFRNALSPYAASLIENRPIHSSNLVAGYQKLRPSYDHVLVEGAGGWETPLTATETIADLATALQLPILLVVNNRLGAINHALLTLRAIASRGLTCRGILLNHPFDERDPASISNQSILEKFTSVPILAELIHGATDLPDVAL